MKTEKGLIYDDVKKCVDEIIEYVGKDIVFGMPLALGKPAMLVNELYKRAKEDPKINLKIVSALALEKPKGNSDLENRFLKSLTEKIFKDTPEFDYMTDFRAGKLPKNVNIYEFYLKAGGSLNIPDSQQNYISSNYTHIVRDGMDLGVNVFGELISCREIDGKTMYSMGCNTDICIETIRVLKEKRSNGEKVAMIGEANSNLPFMYGDAIVDDKNYDIILKGPQFNYGLFGPPKEAVALKDHMIGINVSTLIKDGGTIQVGIGALGDAIAAGLIMRHDHSNTYLNVLEASGILQKNEKLINDCGGTGVFEKGLYGSSEMFVDPFMQMYKSGILKRKVFDSIPLMKLINNGKLAADNIPEDIIDILIEMNAVNLVLTIEDFIFLTEFGILKKGLKYENGLIMNGKVSCSVDMSIEDNRLKIRKLLGKKLLNGQVILGAFFIGPRAFYKALNDMSEEERKLFGMSGVEKVNQLYGDEELRRLQRKDGRFINAAMMANVFGSIISDQLEDGQIVSGIGGQYNFVAMAHALHDARLIMMIRSTRGSGKNLHSNIVFNYGSCSVPKHLRDIIVTEYGIADVRSKPDREVIARIINIADSRFQKQLLEQAKKAGKIPMDYEIPAEYRNNTPEKIEAMLKPFQKDGFFKAFPFGTDLTEDDIALGGSLKAIKALSSGDPIKMVAGLLFELFRPVPESAGHHLKRMELDNPSSLKEKVMQKTVLFALRYNKKIDNVFLKQLQLNYYKSLYIFLNKLLSILPEVKKSEC